MKRTQPQELGAHTVGKQRWHGPLWLLVALLCGAMVWSNCGKPQVPGTESTSDAGSKPDQLAGTDLGKSPDRVAPSPDRVAPSPDRVAPADTANPTDRATPPTGTNYHEHIRGIIAQKCQGCHVKGGIGPFPLTNYKEVKAVSAAIKNAVVSKRMPPWLADNSCGEYKHSLALPDDQIKMFADWVDKGTVEGDPAKYVPPTANGNVGIPRVDLSLKMPVAYTPNGKGTDDYRCFVIDWPLKEKTYVTGFQVKAGNKAIVHHVIAYLGKAKDKAKFQKLDADEAGVGYSCYGGPKGPANWLAAWAPGKPGSEYPKGTGLLVEPGSVVVLQLHYNTLQAKAAPDQTSIEFMTEKTVAKQGYIVPLSSAKWMIPAGQKEYKHINIMDNPLPVAIEVHSVSFHMHLLGTAGRLFIQRDGKEECMLNIPRWDFNWQFFYDLKKPLRIMPTDKIGIECRWNNSPENQPIVDGKRLPPRDVTWGDGTRDEMCLGVVYVTPASL